ncbi:hypothetical protein VC636_10025 [Citrobacter freundii]|uniref:RipA family octameric membrane protein n=1 Tax=Citrobacter freundii TaxID=546 RepID=UPI00292A9977|nr:hypothetical protein [Citrobacter freundii]MDV0675306.1 hypothetical protein [Citrobacter freundii]MDV0860593.1 hypothetical protein [Citrobacter freundii]MEB0574838.1 hypothetical protein [Citrobacter freundii]MEB0714081.1 hypothetical protein [Citrobacter freundii]
MGKKTSVKILNEDIDFFKSFFGEKIESFEEGSRTHTMLHLALDKAHDIRKFEIELYWKRATYFFAFFTVITAAFGYLFTSEKHSLFAPGVSIIGIVLSICFIYVNKGSKYWQCNWEYLIDKLEVYITGNLYKVYFFKSTDDQRPSVSDINLLISYTICSIWHLMFFISLYMTTHWQLITFWFYLISYSISSIYILCSCRKYISSIITKEQKDLSVRNFRFRTPVYKKYHE